MKRKSTAGLLFVFILYTFNSCHDNDRNDPRHDFSLAGCWRGGLVENNKLVERDLQLRLLSLRPDSTLALTAIYEVGPRSRVWEYDTEIRCQDNTISWLAHRGYLSDNGDTMHLTKTWDGEVTQWMFVRDRSYDRFLTDFMSFADTGYKYHIPDEQNDGWLRTDLRDAGIDEAKMTQFIKRVKKGEHGDIHSVLICRDGKLVLEEYFAVDGKISGPFVTRAFRNKVHQLSSVTKGVFSALCGIAIDGGQLPHVDEPIYKYLPHYTNSFTEESRKITVKDMLTMRAGWEWEQFTYEWNDSRNNAAEMYRCADVIKYVLERPLAAGPGKRFKYSNGVPTVMGAVLRNACGMEVDQYAERVLFRPMGISDYTWTRYPDGSLETDGGLALRSRDLAKFGQLFLNDGSWQGDRIISEGWVGESTQSSVSLSRNRGFGYYWNVMKLGDGVAGENALFLPGDGGQFLALFPSIEMVIVITAGNYNMDPTSTYRDLIEDEILPAFSFHKK